MRFIRKMALSVLLSCLFLLASCSKSLVLTLPELSEEFSVHAEIEYGEFTAAGNINRAGEAWELSLIEPDEMDGFCFTKSSGQTEASLDGKTTALTDESVADLIFGALDAIIVRDGLSVENDGEQLVCKGIYLGNPFVARMTESELLSVEYPDEKITVNFSEYFTSVI